jgi:hypothetical protein
MDAAYGLRRILVAVAVQEVEMSSGVIIPLITPLDVKLPPGASTSFDCQTIEAALLEGNAKVSVLNFPQVSNTVSVSNFPPVQAVSVSALPLPPGAASNATLVSIMALLSPQAGFRAYYDSVAPAANKYMAVLFNTSTTRKVVVQRIYAILTNVANANGTALDQELVFITARVDGTVVTPVAEDSFDLLSPGISASIGSTSVVEARVLEHFVVSNANIAVNTSTILAERFTKSSALIYERKPPMRGITLRQNQGIALKNVTNSTAGSLSYLIEFTDEPV